MMHKRRDILWVFGAAWVLQLLVQTSESGGIRLAQSFAFQPIARPHNTFFQNRRPIAFCLEQNVAPRSSSRLSMAAAQSSSSKNAASREKEVVVEAESLFSKSCDKDGLMSKKMLANMKFISELLADGDLLKEELDKIWNAAPKFPDVEASEERIDIDSFVQVYRDIDDLFEDDDNDMTPAAKTFSYNSAVADASQQDTSKDDNDDDVEAMEDELETVFGTICDKDGLISKENLMKWDEIQKLLGDGLIDTDEFESIWEKVPKRPGTTDMLDVDGFLSFNVELDALFDFDDIMDEDDSESSTDPSPKSGPASAVMVEEEGLSPDALFDALAGSDGLVGMDEIKRWGELQDMLDEGDLLLEELNTFFEEVVQSSKAPNKLDRDGFVALYRKIDSLFEADEEDAAAAAAAGKSGRDSEQKQPARQVKSAKRDLLLAVQEINEDKERLPCGLESTEREQKLVMSIANALEAEPTNVVRQKQGAIEMADLEGEWDLLYSSSSAMAYNKGLSGLGGSFPNGSFGGLKMKLTASKYMTDVEYLERINVVPDSASFDVKVTGGWEIRSSVSIFTGEPSIVLTVVPDKVTYGPTSTRADHWKSLGPSNMLDLTYLDEDLRIMRGNTSTDTVFVFKRSKPEK